MGPADTFDAGALSRMQAIQERARLAVEEERRTRDRTVTATPVERLTEDLSQALHELEGLRDAMRTRATIEQAKGVIMLVRNCGPDEAFHELVRLSQTSQVKLHDLAGSLVQQVATGAWSADDVRRVFSRRQSRL
jgi:hypothetical protein